jgi:hypothetical protein
MKRSHLLVLCYFLCPSAKVRLGLLPHLFSEVSTCRPILTSARGATGSAACSPAQFAISMANGALIPYHGCHSHTDDSDFSDSMRS